RKAARPIKPNSIMIRRAFRLFVRQLVAHDERHLSHREENNQNKNSGKFKRNPGIVRLGAPNDLVQKRKREKEAAPTPGEEPPAALRQSHGLIENDRQYRLVQC